MYERLSGGYTHLWGFLPFSVCTLLVVPNPARSLTTAIQGYEWMYRSATTQMDICQLVSVTSEWRYNDHINSVTFLKVVFQINRYKVKWGSSPLHTMSNSDSHVGLFPPSVPVLTAQLTHVHLVHNGCWTIVLSWCSLSCACLFRIIKELKGIISWYTIFMSFNQPDYNRLHLLTTTLDVNTSFTQS